MSRLIGLLGAVLGLVAVGLAAWASHGLAATLAGDDLRRVAIAVAMQFGHALLLLVIAAETRHRPAPLAALAGLAIVLGVALFCGSLWWRALTGGGSSWAPVGGLLLMLGWALVALQQLVTKR